MINQERTVLGCLIFFILLVTLFNTLEAKENSENNLLKRVKLYYMYEKDKDWEHTYKFRTPLFRKSIPWKFYFEQMKKDSKNRKLKDLKIINYKIQNNYALVEIKFTDIYDRGDLDFKLWPKRTLKIITTWENISGVWYCRNAGSNRNFSLNLDMVMKNGQKPIEEEFGLPSNSILVK